MFNSFLLPHPPHDVDLALTTPDEGCPVTKTTYYDNHSGDPKFVREEYADGSVVWSRVSEFLAFVEGQ